MSCRIEVKYDINEEVWVLFNGEEIILGEVREVIVRVFGNGQYTVEYVLKLEGKGCPFSYEEEDLFHRKVDVANYVLKKMGFECSIKEVT